MRASFLFALFLAVSASVLGCGSRQAPVTASISSSSYQLQSEPPGAIGVLQLKAQAKTDEQVVVLGRVGGGQNPWVEGKAALLIVDDGVAPACQDEQCSENCSECALALAEATTLVKFVDPSTQKVLGTDVRELLPVENFQTIVVRGVAVKDKSGNVSINADGIYIRR